MKEWGLKGCRGQAHTFESIAEPVRQLRKQFPTAGAQSMKDHLRLRHGIHVSRYAFTLEPFYPLTDGCQRKLIMEFNRQTDPAGVAARRAGRIRRRVFHAAGVNHIWAFDQHDKWKRFGLRLHLGIEPFTGFLLWMIVWWTNSNPKLVCREYIQAARKYGGRHSLVVDNADIMTPI